jgi:hypothetical protein
MSDDTWSACSGDGFCSYGGRKDNEKKAD